MTQTPDPDEPTIRDVLTRIDDMRAEMELRFTEINATLLTLTTGQLNLFNLWMRHVDDPHAHTT